MLQSKPIKVLFCIQIKTINMSRLLLKLISGQADSEPKKRTEKSIASQLSRIKPPNQPTYKNK